MNVLHVDGLDVRFRHPGRAETTSAVRGLSFDLAAGETLALVGESGSGKSTTGLALLSLLPAEAEVSAQALRVGDVDVLNADDRALRRIRGARAGMVFQDALSALNPLLTIGAQLVDAVRLHRRVDRNEAAAIALDLLRRVRIPDAAQRLHEYPHRLSGGMRQRVVIALALAGQPDILIADEPTTALDVTVQARILALLRELQRDSGLAILLITHDLGVVAEMADRVLVMRAGERLEMQPARDLFDRPQHPYTRELLAARTPAWSAK